MKIDLLGSHNFETVKLSTSFKENFGALGNI